MLLLALDILNLGLSLVKICKFLSDNLISILKQVQSSKCVYKKIRCYKLKVR